MEVKQLNKKFDINNSKNTQDKLLHNLEGQLAPPQRIISRGKITRVQAESSDSDSESAEQDPPRKEKMTIFGNQMTNSRPKVYVGNRNPSSTEKHSDQEKVDEGLSQSDPEFNPQEQDEEEYHGRLKMVRNFRGRDGHTRAWRNRGRGGIKIMGPPREYFRLPWENKDKTPVRVPASPENPPGFSVALGGEKESIPKAKIPQMLLIKPSSEEGKDKKFERLPQEDKDNLLGRGLPLPEDPKGPQVIFSKGSVDPKISEAPEDKQGASPELLRGTMEKGSQVISSSIPSKDYMEENLIIKNPDSGSLITKEKIANQIVDNTSFGKREIDISDQKQQGGEGRSSFISPPSGKIIDQVAQKVKTGFFNRSALFQGGQYTLPKEEQLLYEEALQELDDDQIIFKSEDIYVPGSTSSVNGRCFKFLGGLLTQLGGSYDEYTTMLRSLAKHGFYVPKALLDFAGQGKSLPMSIMIETLPFYFIDLGPNSGPLAIFSQPRVLTDLAGVKEYRVNYDILKRLLGGWDDLMKQKEYISELLTVFYLAGSVGDLKVYSPNAKKMTKAQSDSFEKVAKLTQENKELVDMVLLNPKDYFSLEIPNADIIKKKDEILLINEEQKLQLFGPLELFQTNKTGFSFGATDPVMTFILGYLVQEEVPDKVYDIIDNNYVGSGGLKMVPERYNKSLKVYNKANSEKQRLFHKDWYKQNYVPFVQKYGYYVNLEDDEFVPVPKTAQEYLEMTTPTGERLFPINPHSRGTITSREKRGVLGLAEIQAGLDNWRNFDEDPNSDTYSYFYIGFKNISAKLKNEIHSYSKPPRFYNPTFIGAFIPFQFVFNQVFSKCPPLSTKCPHSLLGIEDVDYKFSELMEIIWDSPDIQLHYSDNFWIKEGDLYVSVDVERCDSNLSVQALYYPLMTCGKMVLTDEAFKTYSKIVDIFVGTIPRGGIFSFGRGKKFCNILLPFFWLPSGVVGTPYFNHMFTGAFLYFSQGVKWINPDGTLTTEILDKANAFGISLEVASFVDFSKKGNGDIVEFDLLGRSGIICGEKIVPVLEESRLWKSYLFMKKDKYDKNPLIANYVRLQKLEGMVHLGGLLYPVLRDAIFTALVSISALVRGKMVSLTSEQANQLIEELSKFNIDPLSFESYIFKGFIPSIKEYVTSKTGDSRIPKSWEEFDKKIKGKLLDYPLVWGALMPVLKGEAKEIKYFHHSQNSEKPYFVAHYMPAFLNMIKKGKGFNFSNLNKFVYGFFGFEMGSKVLSGLIHVLGDMAHEGTGKKFSKEFKEVVFRFAKDRIEKGRMSKTEAKEMLDALQEEFINKEGYKKLKFGEDPLGKRFILDAQGNKINEMCFAILNQMDFYEIMRPENNPDLWNTLRLGGYMPERLNRLMSVILFEGVDGKRVAKEKLACGALPDFKKFRELPKFDFSYKIFDPKALEYENAQMVVENIAPSLLDLGMLTGYITRNMRKKEIKGREAIKAKDFVMGIQFNPINHKVKPDSRQILPGGGRRITKVEKQERKEKLDKYITYKKAVAKGRFHYK